MVWSPPEDSPAARIDEADYIARCAKDLQACEPPKRPQPVADAVSRGELERTIDSLCVTIGKAVRRMVVAPLEARIAELEQRQWFGVWQQGKSYAKNAIVSHRGSAWVAVRQYPQGKPGTADSGWKLIVKCGRDGKDAK